MVAFYFVQQAEPFNSSRTLVGFLAEQNALGGIIARNV